MYVAGMVVAIISVIVMRYTTMRGESAPFIMELPTYHMPGFKSLMLHLWDKLKHFIKKAFTIILASTIIIWFLQSFGWDWKMVDDANTSILASLGQLIQPLFTPLGFGKQIGEYGWVFAVAAITGLIAKENVIATFFALASALISAGAIQDASIIGEISGLEEATEDGVLEVQAMIAATGITKAGLLAFIVFNMTTIPCFAAIATAKAELPGNKIWSTILFWIVVSFISGTVVFLTMEYVWPLAIIIVLAVLAGVGIYFFNKYRDNKNKTEQISA